MLAAAPSVEIVIAVGSPPTTSGGVRVVEAGDLVAGAPAPRSLADPTPADACAVIYTSGTTGPAKGVLVRWGQLQTAIGNVPADWLGPDPAVYSPWPVFHVTGKAAPVMMAAVGGRVVLRRSPSVREFWNDVRAHRCTYAVSGFIADLLVAQPEHPDDVDNPLRVTIQGPAVARAEAFQRRFGVRIVVSYGMTEIGVPLVNRDVTDTNAAAAGRPKLGYEVCLVGADGTTCDDDEAGELLVRASDPSMMNAGYVGVSPDPAPWRKGGWFATGDAFRRDASGLYTFVDRLKDTIRRRGQNISSFDVESTALRHPAVQEAAAVPVPATGGEDEVHLVLVTAEEAFDVADLRHHMEDHLPRFMSPRYYSVVDALPKTANGKVRKVELRAAGLRHLALDTGSTQK